MLVFSGRNGTNLIHAPCVARSAFCCASALVIVTDTVQAQTSGMERRENRRDNRDEAREGNGLDLRQRLPRLDIPMHFIWGRHDVFATPEMADALMQLLPNATFEWFEDSGHVCQNDEPERYNAVASRFFFDR